MTDLTDAHENDYAYDDDYGLPPFRSVESNSDRPTWSAPVIVLVGVVVRVRVR